MKQHCTKGCAIWRYISDGRNKNYRFILCSIVYIVVSQNTLFPVIPFHHLSDCDLYTPPTTGREGETETGGDENDQLGHNQELVPKRGTTYVAWLRVFKHCSFKTNDFKPLKYKQQSNMRAPSNTIYMHAPSLSVWGSRRFFFADFE